MLQTGPLNPNVDCSDYYFSVILVFSTVTVVAIVSSITYISFIFIECTFLYLFMFSLDFNSVLSFVLVLCPVSQKPLILNFTRKYKKVKQKKCGHYTDNFLLLTFFKASHWNGSVHKPQPERNCFLVQKVKGYNSTDQQPKCKRLDCHKDPSLKEMNPTLPTPRTQKSLRSV